MSSRGAVVALSNVQAACCCSPREDRCSPLCRMQLGSGAHPTQLCWRIVTIGRKGEAPAQGSILAQTHTVSSRRSAPPTSWQESPNVEQAVHACRHVHQFGPVHAEQAVQVGRGDVRARCTRQGVCGANGGEETRGAVVQCGGHI